MSIIEPTDTKDVVQDVVQGDSNNEPKKHIDKNRIIVVAAAILALFGLGGIIFGITKINQEPKTSSVAANVNGGPYIKDGFFYVPEWGWKYKIPDNLTDVGFSVDYSQYYSDYEKPFIGFSAVDKGANKDEEEHESAMDCSLIGIARTKEDISDEDGDSVYIDENGNEVDPDNALPGKNVGNGGFKKDGYSVRLFDYSDYCGDESSASYETLEKMFKNPEVIK